MNIDTNKLADGIDRMLQRDEAENVTIYSLLAVIKQQAEALDLIRVIQGECGAATGSCYSIASKALAASAPLVKRFDEAAREKAEAEVLRVRGSYDAPGFDACVDAEMVKLVEGV